MMLKEFKSSERRMDERIREEVDDVKGRTSSNKDLLVELSKKHVKDFESMRTVMLNNNDVCVQKAREHAQIDCIKIMNRQW